MLAYDPGKVLATLGPLSLAGFADGSMIEVTPLGPGDQVTAGTSGENVLVRSRDRRHEVKVRIWSNSATATALAIVWNAGNPIQPLVIKDLLSPRTDIAPECVIKQWPGKNYSNEPVVMEFVFVTGAMESL